MIMKTANTVLFEEKYKVNIKEFATTSEIDEFIAKKEGKKNLEVVSIGTDIVSARGAIIPIVNMDIDGIFDKATKK